MDGLKGPHACRLASDEPGTWGRVSFFGDLRWYPSKVALNSLTSRAPSHLPPSLFSLVLEQNCSML